MRRRLTNDDWGLDTNCFVCEPRNDEGLRIPFYVDDEARTVEAPFTLGNAFSGAPTMLHGGLGLAVLDEAQAWAAIALGGKWAVTTETSATFRRAVMIDEPHVVVAWLTDADETTIVTEGEIRTAPPEGPAKICVRSRSTFAVLSAAQARRATGTDDVGGVADYLR